MKTFIGMAKINWRYSVQPYLITGITVLLGLADLILAMALRIPGNESVAIGNYLYLLPLCMAIFVPARNFSRLMHLGGTRMDFFKGALLTYTAAAAITGLLSLVTHLTVDKWMVSRGLYAGIQDLLDVYGFMARGPAAAFFQMTAFLLLTASAAHTLTLIQGRWYGWVVDTLIVAIISVFTPIAPLRAALVWFFNMIIFHDIAAVQILSCMILGTAIYCASLIPIKSRQI
jgi:hypothetical protein